MAAEDTIFQSCTPLSAKGVVGLGMYDASIIYIITIWSKNSPVREKSADRFFITDYFPAMGACWVVPALP